MVKLKGPAVSTDALGTIADVLTFQKGKRGTIAKKHAKPKQPNSAAQIGVQANVKWLAQQWSTLTAAEMATWFKRAQLMNVANYHAYLSANSKRYHNFLMPAKEDPATEVGGFGNMAHCYVQKFDGNIRYSAKSRSPPVNWGYILCRSQVSAFTPGPENTIALFLKTPATFDRYWDFGLPNGTYYYRCAGFDDTGAVLPFFGELAITLP